MKIAVWHNLPSGGGKRALYYHVRGLIERGHVLDCWCPPTADQQYLPLSELTTEHVVPLDWQPIRARGRIRRSLAPYNNMANQLGAMDRHCRQCAEQMNRLGFELLFANACQFFRVTSIGRYVKMPKVLYLQEPYRWLYEAMPRLPWLALPNANGGSYRSPTYLKRFVKDLIRVQALRIQAREELLNAQAYDAILVNSLFSRESILRAYGLDARVCYLGVDTKIFANSDQPRQNLIIGIGAFVPEKNIPFVIEALGRVSSPRPHLVWVGNVGVPDHVEELKQIAHAYGVSFEPRLRVDDEELVNLLNRARLMVYAPRLEPFGLASLEANACGVPVVAVAEGGIRETIVHGVNGLLVEHDPQAMARAIRRLLDNPEYAAQLGKNGCSLVAERWSLSASIDRLEQRLAEVSDLGSQPATQESTDARLATL